MSSTGTERAAWAIPRGLVADLARRAGRSVPREACGLLVEGAAPGSALEVVELENRAAQPERAFVLDPGDVVREHLKAESRGGRVAATWHSHPSGAATPSAADLELTRAWPDLVHVIVTPRGDVAAWGPSGPIDGPIDVAPG